MQGDTLVVAASDDDYGVVGNSNTVGVHDQGSAYVFTRSGGVWTQRAHLLDADLPAKSYYGQSVSISGDTIAIASALQGDGNTISAAYIYTGSADSWSLQQKVQLSHPVRDGNGYDLTVALSGNRLALGNFTVNSDQGEVRMFQRSGATWAETAALSASDGAAGDRFGRALSLDDDWLMVGAPWDDVGGNVNQGAAYLYRLTDSNWKLVERISPAAAAGEQVGLSVAIHDRNIFLGAPFTDVSGTTDRGKVYSYRATEIPNITSLTPPIAEAGDTVVIRGSGFSATAGDNFVSFGPVRAAVTNASETQLTVVVPLGSTYGSVGVQVAGRAGFSQQYFTPRSAGSETLSASSFAAPTAISGGYAAWHGVGDIDGDGRVDLVTSNYDDYVWKVYRNVLTQGSLAAGAAFPAGTLDAPVVTSVGFGPIGGGLGDFDGDGRLDFVFCDYRAGNSVSLYRNTSSAGSISFGTRQSFGAGASSEQLTLGDVDGDGRLDIIVANGGYPGTDNRISVLRNRSVLGGPIDFDSPVFFTVVDRPYSVEVGDLNGDGKPEIIAGGQSSQSISILTNQSAGPGDVAFGNRVDYLQSRDIYSILPSDIDRDGKLDLVLGSYSYSSTTVLYNKVANGTIDANSFATKFSIATTLAMPYGSVGDLDGNDAVDLAFGNTSNSTLTLMVNGSPVSGDPPITFTSFGVNSGQDRPALTNIIDIDGDGRNDVVTSSANGRQLTLTRSIIHQALRSAAPANPPLAPVDGNATRAEVPPSAAVSVDVAVATPTADPVDDATLAKFLRRAFDLWRGARIDLRGVTEDQVAIEFADLPDFEVGLSSSHTVWLDRDAAGWGWFFDPTPNDNEEFIVRPSDGGLVMVDASGGVARFANSFDALTVIAHELGHVLGLTHAADGSRDVMEDSLMPGVRRLPLSREERPDASVTTLEMGLSVAASRPRVRNPGDEQGRADFDAVVDGQALRPAFDAPADRVRPSPAEVRLIDFWSQFFRPSSRRERNPPPPASHPLADWRVDELFHDFEEFDRLLARELSSRMQASSRPSLP
ncbi:MAG TPA: FG-GAP-like repeat-containing protein, partial [Pirellulaceae bacterium]|nr:FG-GAP-like repeat-containing protein [Pirellulaceae bacterium]